MTDSEQNGVSWGIAYLQFTRCVAGHHLLGSVKLVCFTAIFISLFASVTAFDAKAHVKWFAPFDVTSDPVSVSSIPLIPFAIITFAVMAVFQLFVVLERTSFKGWAIAVLDGISTPFRSRLDDMMRAGAAAFFVSLWVVGGVLLTPELKTEISWISWMQAGLAICLFWQNTLPFVAIGIVFLWTLAAGHYGLFHLLDYPIFLGIAAYFGVCAFPNSMFFRYRLDILRWGAAITLMWASIEKFAYPEWAYPVLEKMPFLTLGLSKANFMILAGVAEFVLAFALLWSSMIRRMSALLLAVIFAAAIIPFGKIDAIGHLMIILILIVVVVDRQSVAVPASNYFAVPKALFWLVFFFFIYYVAQAQFPGLGLVWNHIFSGH